MKLKRKPSRLTKALLETADDMRRAGIMDEVTPRSQCAIFATRRW